MNNNREYMNKILFDICRSHHVRSMSFVDDSYTKDIIGCFVEACGDEILGYTLYLMGNEYSHDDLQDMAPYFGVGFREKTKPGLVVNDIPPAPDTSYRWDYMTEEWKKAPVYVMAMKSESVE